jgi:hypothetical protein
MYFCFKKKEGQPLALLICKLEDPPKVAETHVLGRYVCGQCRRHFGPAKSLIYNFSFGCV